MKKMPESREEKEDFVPAEGYDEAYPEERASQKAKRRYTPYKQGGHGRTKALGFGFSGIELQHLIISWLAISLAFGLLLSRDNLLQGMVIAAGTVGLGFIGHELAHKLLAQHYGCVAEFRAFFPMLAVAVALAYFAGIVFAAPGAVMIGGRATPKQIGKISLAGPVANMALALVFLNFLLLGSGMVQEIGKYGFMINSWLALFNLIPLGFLNGAKVLRWNKSAYAIAVGVAFALSLGQMVL
ncbi:MAG: hypothetical protein V1735_00405 [Nanoarchaeota archaeon]